MRAALQPRRVGAMLLALLFVSSTHRTDAQTTAGAEQGEETYNLSVSVDEVALTFHAADAHGVAVNDLRLADLRLLDNGRPPRKVLAFRSLQDLPIRVGILMDASESMGQHLAGERATSIGYAQGLLHRQADEAFIMEFGRLSKILQPWTSDPAALTAGIRKVSAGGESRLAGTAIFDTLYRVCLNQFGKIDQATTGNVILLFSDGEDNGSSLELKAAIDMCQRSNTAVYAVRSEPDTRSGSTGPATLAELAVETGGRLFRGDASQVEIQQNLRIIEADLRDQYRLVYKPAELRHDGQFHRIELGTPERVASILVRSGYYAPGRRAPDL